MSGIARHRPTGAVVGAVIGAVMIGTVALVGCGSGQIAQTSEQVAAVGGTEGAAGQVLVRDAQIEFGERVEGANIYAVGANAPLRMSIVNVGDVDDRLVAVNSEIAQSVQIGGDARVPAGQVLVVEGEAAEPAETAAPGATASAQPGATGAPGEGEAPATTSAPTPSAPPGEGSERRTATVVLTGLREDVRAGLTYPVVMTFERAGDVLLEVPVGNPAEPREAEPAG